MSNATWSHLIGSQSGVVDVEAMPWIDLPGIKGSSFKLIRTVPETGGSVFLMKIAPGIRPPLHKHLGSVEIFILKGELTSEGKTVPTGGYLYELGGLTHREEPPEHEEVIALFFAHGPLQLCSDEGELGTVIDNDLMLQVMEQVRNAA